MRTAEEILKDIITDVDEMRNNMPGYGAGEIFGPLITGDGTEAYVEWPNLHLLVMEASHAMKGKNEKRT